MKEPSLLWEGLLCISDIFRKKQAVCGRGEYIRRKRWLRQTFCKGAEK